MVHFNILDHLRHFKLLYVKLKKMHTCHCLLKLNSDRILSLNLFQTYLFYFDFAGSSTNLQKLSKTRVLVFYENNVNSKFSPTLLKHPSSL